MVNPFKYHIVQFRDGKYGIRKFSITKPYIWHWVFLDIHSPLLGYFIQDCSVNIRCKGTYNQVQDALALHNKSKVKVKRDYGKPI